VALRDPLRCEVLTRGYTAEFHSLDQLAEVATSIEDTVHYDMGTQIIDSLGSTNVAQQKPRLHRAWVIITSRPQTTGLWLGNTVSKSLLTQQTRPPALKGANRPQSSQRKPAEARAAPGIAPRRVGPVCFRCGQSGHYQDSCPQPPEKPCVAAVCMEGDRQEKEATEVASDVSLQEEEIPPVDDKRGKTLSHQSPSPGKV